MTIVILILLVVLSGASFYFYQQAIANSAKDFLADNRDLEKPMTPVSDHSDDPKVWIKQQEMETIEITSYDGLKLKGYYLQANKQTNKTVIIAHGYSGQAKDMGRYAKFYYKKLGYNVLLPDARGHGASAGHYIGFGWHERKDYVCWIEQIINKTGQDVSIVLHGVSMGGATVLMTSGEKLPQQVKAVIADCGYTSAKEVLTYQLKRMYHLPSFPLVQITSLLTKIRAGFTFGEASAVKQVKKAEVPILFIHGEEDTFVPTEMVFELFEKTRSHKDLLLVPEATHGQSYAVNMEAYENKIIEFIRKYEAKR
jgi:fermentation-respiration switch protein FrsA (DUF1100 family)